MSDYKYMVQQMIVGTFTQIYGKFQANKPEADRREMVVVFNVKMAPLECGSSVLELSLYGKNNYVEIRTRTIKRIYDEVTQKETNETADWMSWGEHDSAWRSRISHVLDGHKLRGIQERNQNWFELRPRA